MYEKIKREIRIGKFFNHPHIVKLYQYIDSAQYIFVVIELAAGGELFELISRKEKVCLSTARNRFFSWRKMKQDAFFSRSSLA